jgi:hypothetical protein
VSVLRGPDVPAVVERGRDVSARGAQPGPIRPMQLVESKVTTTGAILATYASSNAEEF